MIEVSDTMIAQDGEKKKIHYIVIKIGDKVYSTTFGQIPCVDLERAEHQETSTKNIGKEDNFWIKGKFTETNKHTKMEAPIPFELNIYSEPPKVKQTTLK